MAKKATTIRNRPDTAIRISIAIRSASGPNTSIPKGIIALATMLWTPKTRPRKSSSTFSCKSVMLGAFRSGMKSPTKPIRKR